MPDHIFDEDRFPDFGVWVEEMASITEFTGINATFKEEESEYTAEQFEENCRAMVINAVNFLQMKMGYPPDHLSDKLSEEAFEYIGTHLDEAQDTLVQVLQAGSNYPPSSAQISAAMGHAVFIWHKGWEHYAEEMMRGKLAMEESGKSVYEMTTGTTFESSIPDELRERFDENDDDLPF